MIIIDFPHICFQSYGKLTNRSCILHWSSCLLKPVEETLGGVRFYFCINDYSCFPITFVVFFLFIVQVQNITYVRYHQVPVTWKNMLIAVLTFPVCVCVLQRELSSSNLSSSRFSTFWMFLKRMKELLLSAGFSPVNGVTWQSLTRNTAE